MNMSVEYFISIHYYQKQLIFFSFLQIAKKVKKSGDGQSKLVQYSKREHNLQREKQYKRQTTQYTGDFSKPPYTSPQKDIETIWYTEPKKPVRHYCCSVESYLLRLSQ